VTNHPRGWHEQEGQQGLQAAALRALAEAGDAERHSHDAVSWWRYHVLDSPCVRDKSDSPQCERHRARAPSHRVRGVVPADRALLLAGNAACRQIGEGSLALPGFRLALHAPIAGARSDSPAGVGSGDGKDSVRGGGKLSETHRGWLPRLSESLAQVPDPLGKNLTPSRIVCKEEAFQGDPIEGILQA